MNLICTQLNTSACKTYLIQNKGSSEVILIDPVIGEMEAYQRILSEKKIKVKLIIDTHTHADHLSAASGLMALYDCDYAVHHQSPNRCKTVALHHDQSFELWEGIFIDIIHTPGHTKDSISLIFPDWIFTGDALFLDDGGAGRDDLPGGDPSEHWESLVKLQGLPDHLIVFPAHDYRERQPSPLSIQKQTNPHLIKSREGKDSFVDYLRNLKLGPAGWMVEVVKANIACEQDSSAVYIPDQSPVCEVKGTFDPKLAGIEVDLIEAADLKKSLRGKDRPLVLDVRDPDEIKKSGLQIEGLKNIPINQLQVQLNELEDFKNNPVVTVCAYGGRAHMAAQILTSAGFLKVTSLNGGMNTWNE